MIVGLLLFCVAAPRYWQHDASPSVADADMAGTHGASEFTFKDLRPAAELNGDPLNLWSPPTIDELIAARSMHSQFDATYSGGYGQSAGWLPFSRTSDTPFADREQITSPESTPAIDSHPIITTSLESVGAAIAECSTANILTRVFSQLPPFTFARSNVTPIPEVAVRSSNASLRLVGPGDRLAMIPSGSKDPAWCVPQVLYEQLTRLGDHAYSAQWASHVSNQLHALTERKQLEGDDVQSILADLADSAQEAIEMADNTDNDRLRVELLRAHWGLARRLDCWAAMHEERIASQFRGRVAARGELSPYFDSAATQYAPPTDVVALSKNLETYEKNRDPELGRLVVAEQRALSLRRKRPSIALWPTPWNNIIATPMSASRSLPKCSTAW